jgi:hypothetical protein
MIVLISSAMPETRSDSPTISARAALALKTRRMASVKPLIKGPIHDSDRVCELRM